MLTVRRVLPTQLKPSARKPRASSAPARTPLSPSWSACASSALSRARTSAESASRLTLCGPRSSSLRSTWSASRTSSRGRSSAARRSSASVDSHYPPCREPDPSTLTGRPRSTRSTVRCATSPLPRPRRLTSSTTWPRASTTCASSPRPATARRRVMLSAHRSSRSMTRSTGRLRVRRQPRRR